MRVHHLNCATFCPLGGHFFDGRTPGLRRARLVCHCLLIEAGDRLILVDTGLGLNDVSHPHPRLSHGLTVLLHPRLARAETAHAQISALGYSAAESSTAPRARPGSASTACTSSPSCRRKS